MRQKNVTGGNSRSSARSGSENAKDLYPPAGQRQPTLDFFPLKRSGGADDLCHSSPHGSFTQSRATADSFPAFANRQLTMPFFRADTFGKMYSPSLNTLVSTLTPATTYRRYLHPQLALLPFCPQSRAALARNFLRRDGPSSCVRSACAFTAGRRRWRASAYATARAL